MISIVALLTAIMRLSGRFLHILSNIGIDSLPTLKLKLKKKNKFQNEKHFTIDLPRRIQLKSVNNNIK